jgi:hypothetical protein
MSRAITCIIRGMLVGATYSICNASEHKSITGLFEMIVGVLTTCHTQYI